MAEAAPRTILEALGRAALAVRGVPLFVSKTETGLFPSTGKGRALAERCKEDGLLETLRTETRGKQSAEICAITDKGRDLLLEQSSPRQLIEDFLRVLESRGGEVSELVDRVDGLASALREMRDLCSRLAPGLSQANPSRNGHHAAPKAELAGDALIAEIKARLAEWHANPGTTQDCPLPELHRRLEAERPASIGQFHDALRALYDDHQIYLHPWTGPLYALPEPPFALLIGHEIAYYASIR